jgi:hypothetical protein
MLLNSTIHKKKSIKNTKSLQNLSNLIFTFYNYASTPTLNIFEI